MGGRAVPFQNILIRKTEGVGWIVLNRPERMNALTRAALGELAAALGEMLGASDVGAVVLTGAGDRAFTSGVDIGEFLGLDARAGMAYADEGRELAGAIEAAPKPVLAALNGLTLGGGVELALACHLRVASDTARLGLPEVKLGLIPGWGGTQRLPRLVGRGRALEIILTGRTIDAAEALSLGLVNRVVPAAALEAACGELAREILGNAPRALENGLRAVLRGLDRPLADGLTLERECFGKVASTQDLREGARAFLEKRKPKWSGR